jgi:hypothetical protein
MSPIFGTGFTIENRALFWKHFAKIVKKSSSDLISSFAGILSSKAKLESYFFLFAGSISVS